jgi:heme A synthase
MREFLAFLLTMVMWAVLWGFSAALFTVLSIIASTMFERYLLLQERWSYPIWIVALGLCPLVAFVGSWTFLGLLLPDELYSSVRLGGLASGIMFAVIGVRVVTKGSESDKDDKASEAATLIASLLTDAACCVALIWFFEPIAGFMGSLGGG